MGSLPYGKSLVPRPLALLCGAARGLRRRGRRLVRRRPARRRPGAGRPEPTTLTVKAGTAQLELRAGWQADARVPRVPGIDTTNAQALAPADGGAGRMIDRAGQARGRRRELPAATLEALRVPLRKPERATVGSLRGTGYTALSLRGVSGLVDIYTFRTVAGLLTVSCIAPVDDPLPTGSCPADISTHLGLRARGARSGRGAQERAAAGDRGAGPARMNGRLALRRGADSDAQVSAARSISAAYGAAADSGEDRTGEGLGLVVAGRVPLGVRGLRGAGSAARSYDKAAWERASAAVNEAELDAATALGAVGA